jgi:Antibiotic biosynthesis monooxygenase
MIFIVISIDTRPEKRDDFLAGITRYCAQVRAEPGNLRFTCSEDVEEPNRFVVVANYADQAAGEALVRDGRGTPRIGYLRGYRRPSSVARRTAAWRVLTSSLAKMCLVWVRSVLTDTNR